MKIAIQVRQGVATTHDSAGKVIVGPFSFAATRFVTEDSSQAGPGDGTFVYEGEWTVPPRPESQPS
jgi:hypothetical protein